MSGRALAFAISKQTPPPCGRGAGERGRGAVVTRRRSFRVQNSPGVVPAVVWERVRGLPTENLDQVHGPLVTSAV